MSYDNKSYGGFNVISTVNPGDFDSHAATFRDKLKDDKYDKELSYLSDTGAYVLVDNDHNYNPDEIAAAKAMADAGIIVELTSEKDVTIATAIKPDGTELFSDGRLCVENLSFEQKTRSEPAMNNPDAGAKIVKGALEHARDKRSDIALLYDKAGTLHQGDVSAGIDLYDAPQFAGTNAHKFKAIIIIDKYGGVHEWRHKK